VPDSIPVSARPHDRQQVDLRRALSRRFGTGTSINTPAEVGGHRQDVERARLGL
jgi:hypothetical protein